MIIMDASRIDALLDQMSAEINHLFAQQPEPIIVGIHTGGFWLAEALQRRLGLTEPVGSLDISYYRDDLAQAGLQPRAKPSSLPALDERHVLLVDDVLYTGRTIRAAMNELFDYGRPASIRLAVLIQRTGRQLPICADVVGEHLHPQPSERLKLSGPDPLALHLIHA